MNTSIFLTIAMLCTSCPMGMAQTAYSLPKALIFLHNGTALSGALAALEQDSITVQSSGTSLRLACADIEQIIVQESQYLGRGVVYGSLIGMYIGNLLFAQATGQPSTFLRADMYGGSIERRNNDLKWLLMGGAYIGIIGVGGGLGYWINGDSKKYWREYTYLFNGDAEEQRRAWSRLGEYIHAETRHRRIRISTQSVYIISTMSEPLQTALTSAGYYFSSWLYRFSPELNSETYEEASSLNLFRNIHAEYELLPALSVGVSIVFLGEPTLSADYSAQVFQQVNATGYYATGMYTLLEGAYTECRVGGGIGIVHGNYTVDFSDTRNQINAKVSGTPISALLTGELSFRIYEECSLGIAADCAFVPSIGEAPALPGLLPARPIRLGNGSIGLLISLHL